MKKIAALLILTIFCLCSRKTEVFKLDIDTSKDEEQLSHSRGEPCIIEYYVISNPPDNPRELRIFVDSFMSNSLSLPDSEIAYSVNRGFYKETHFTPREYKENEKIGGYFDNGVDEIQDHSRDLILNYTLSKGVVSPGPLYPSSEIGKIYRDEFYTFYKNGKVLDNNSIHLHKIINSKPNPQPKRR
jgi:hypothetical protein